MVAIPEPDMTVKEEAFQNGKATFEMMVKVYNKLIEDLRKIEHINPEKCVAFLEGNAFPLTNHQMVEMLYFMQQTIDDIENLDLD